MSKPIQKTDRRIAKTRLALRNAMLSLLAEQGWDSMSIQSICDKADVGRSTFYLHFSSKHDLLLESLAEFRDALIAQATATSARPVVGVLASLFDHVKEQLPVFKMVIGRRSTQIVANSFRNMIVELVKLELKRCKHPATEQQPWLAQYIAGGIYETMTWWVDEAQPPEIHALEEQLAGMINLTLESSVNTPPFNAK